jgi:hypothetical protein
MEGTKISLQNFARFGYDRRKLPRIFCFVNYGLVRISFVAIVMSMNDFFDSSQIIESLYSEKSGKVGSEAFHALPFAKQCLAKGDIYSSDCRLSISKLITANAQAMYEYETS